MLDGGCANSGPGGLGVLEVTQTDKPGFYILHLLNQVLDFEVTWQNCSGRNGSTGYSRPERDGEDLVSKRGQDLVENFVNT